MLYIVEKHFGIVAAQLYISITRVELRLRVWKPRPCSILLTSGRDVIIWWSCHCVNMGLGPLFISREAGIEEASSAYLIAIQKVLPFLVAILGLIDYLATN